MKVVNLRKEHYTVYIGRGSIFGNPFVMGRDGDRTTVIQKYREYALKNPRLLREIAILPEDAILGCFCKPLACHGDVIVELHLLIKEGKLWTTPSNGS
jgi:hypothetical protein